jgi:general secretion pathway protein I
VKRRREAGFTLLEVIVALMIAALALGVLFQSALAGLRSTGVAAHYEQAVSRARSRLALAEHGSPLAPGDWQGDDGGGFHWRLRVAPIARTAVQPVGAAIPGGSSSSPITLYALRVWISWQDAGASRAVQLNTEQIGQASR